MARKFKTSTKIAQRNKAIQRAHLQALSLCYVPRGQLPEYVANTLGLSVTTVREVIACKVGLVGCYDDQ
jgi:hypothetical protein